MAPHRKLDISCARWRLQSDFLLCPFEHNFPFALCTAIRRDTYSLSHTTASRVPAVTRGHQAALSVCSWFASRARARAPVFMLVVRWQLIGQNNWFFLHTAAGASARTRVLLICDTLMHINHSAATNSITSSQTCALHHPPWKIISQLGVLSLSLPMNCAAQLPFICFNAKNKGCEMFWLDEEKSQQRFFCCRTARGVRRRTWMEIYGFFQITFYRLGTPNFFKVAVLKDFC